VSARTVAKYMWRPYDGVPSPTWRTLLTDHAKHIWACDFFGVRTVFFRTLYVFFVMHHETRQILQVRVTRHPTADWTAQQVVDTCAGDRDPPRYLLRDRDSRYGEAFDRRLRGLGVRQLRTPLKRRGQTRLLNAGSDPRGPSVWIICSSSTSATSSGCWTSTSPTSMRGVPIRGSASGRRADQLRRPRPTRQAGSSGSRCSGACIMCISMQRDGRMELLRLTGTNFRLRDAKTTPSPSPAERALCERSPPCRPDAFTTFHTIQ
jgi:hypothetical protein